LDGSFASSSFLGHLYGLDTAHLSNSSDASTLPYPKKERMPTDVFCFSQISKALTGTDRKDLMRKLPKFIYDEEKALEVRSCSCFCNP
jgi:hypothetical protein